MDRDREVAGRSLKVGGMKGLADEYAQEIVLEEGAFLAPEGGWVEAWTMSLERGARFPTLSPQLWFQKLAMDADVFHIKDLNCKVKEPVS